MLLGFVSRGLQVLTHVQANELELALDVYNQLLREGCQPNLVTYNILIDIYGKMGSWQEAVQVLDALEGQVGHAAATHAMQYHSSTRLQATFLCGNFPG